MTETKQIAELIKSVRIEKSMSQKHSLVQSYINKEGKRITLGITDNKTVSLLTSFQGEGDDGTYTTKTQDITNIFESSPCKYYIAIKDGKLTAKNGKKLRTTSVVPSPKAPVLSLNSKDDEEKIEVDIKKLYTAVNEATKISSDSSNVGFFIENDTMTVVSVANNRATFYTATIPCGAKDESFSILSLYTFSKVVEHADSISSSERSIWCRSKSPDFMSVNLKTSTLEVLKTAKNFDRGKKVATLSPESTKELKSEVRTAASINATPKSVPDVSMKIDGKSVEISLHDYSGGGSQATDIKLKEDTGVKINGIIRPTILPFLDTAKDMQITLSDDMYLLVMKTDIGHITTMIGRKKDDD